jgi:glycosyltransferase involved in cell wall biosynthesis
MACAPLDEDRRRVNTPFFSVVMPTHQRRRSLERTLTALAKQEYPIDRLELIVVCDGCTDGSAQTVRELALPFATTVIEQFNQGPAAARNSALEVARGPYVLFLDDDVVALPGLLAAHALGHGEALDRVVIGTLLPPVRSRSPWVAWELQTVVRQYDAMERGEYRAGPRQFFTGNASAPLERIRAAGGFDVSFRRAEDVELAFRLQRLGLQFVFRRAAAGLHLADRTYSSWLEAAFQYGRNDVIMGRQRGRPDMLQAIAGEFHERNRLTRRLISWTLRRPRAARLMSGPVAGAARLAHVAGGSRLSYPICSSLFNVRYWSGVATELGSSQAAQQLIELGRRPLAV